MSRRARAPGGSSPSRACSSPLPQAQVYGPYTNERLVGRAISGRRDQVEIATKFGFSFDPENPYGPRGLDGSPENVKRVCDESLERLGTDYIDLCPRPHPRSSAGRTRRIR